MVKKRPCQSLISPSHSHIVAAFNADKKLELAAELNWFSQAKNIREAIVKAAESLVPNNHGKAKRRTKRHLHQRRLKGGVIHSATSGLLDKKFRFKRKMPFVRIFAVVTETIGSLPGVGPLYIYDIALRLGAHLKSYPDKVYLHAGALKGAKRLFPGTPLGRTMSRDSFPKEYHSLAPYEIENLLCIYHECIPAPMKIHPSEFPEYAKIQNNLAKHAIAAGAKCHYYEHMLSIGLSFQAIELACKGILLTLGHSQVKIKKSHGHHDLVKLLNYVHEALATHKNENIKKCCDLLERKPKLAGTLYEITITQYFAEHFRNERPDKPSEHLKPRSYFYPDYGKYKFPKPYGLLCALTDLLIDTCCQVQSIMKDDTN